MITVAISEVFYFVEFNPLSAFTGGENGMPDQTAELSAASLLSLAGITVAKNSG